jgi:hypothetical protein
MKVDSLHPVGGGKEGLNRRARRAQRNTPFSLSVASVCSCLKIFICVNLSDLPAPLAHSTALFHSAIPGSFAGGRAAFLFKHFFSLHFAFPLHSVKNGAAT